MFVICNGCNYPKWYVIIFWEKTEKKHRIIRINYPVIYLIAPQKHFRNIDSSFFKSLSSKFFAFIIQSKWTSVCVSSSSTWLSSCAFVEWCFQLRVGLWSYFSLFFLLAVIVNDAIFLPKSIASWISQCRSICYAFLEMK